MSDQLKNPAPTDSAAPAAKHGKPENSKPRPGKPDDDKKPKPAKPAGDDKKPKPKQLLPLQAYAGTVGEYGANPDGVYDHFTLTPAEGPAHLVKFPPHVGQALHTLAQPGQQATLLGHLHTTPKGKQHLHLARIEAGGQQLRPSAPKNTEQVDLQGTLAEILLDPKGQPRGLRLSGEAAELRFPPHLGAALADLLTVGAAVQASGTRKPAHPGELRVPGTQPPLQLELLTVGGQSFLIQF
jgi:hypothetical protein